ncbi:MAG: DUF4153 domain-containing protein [Kiritimatiellae bacterium]|nr:DUF4153 domain-containing protein [Kiritimatiellia bacterium]
MKTRIIQAAEDPRELERLYRANPKDFTGAFREAFAERRNSPVLAAWNERLFFQEAAEEPKGSAPGWPSRDIGLTIALALVAGTLAKLPHFLPALDDERFYLCNLGGIVAGALIAFFCLQKACRVKTAAAIAALLAGGIVYLNLLPYLSRGRHTLILSCLHMPFVFWSLLGIAFLGGRWRDLRGRMAYIQYNGELLIYSTILLIGGMVLTGLTFALFELIGLRIENWYMKNVVVYGAMAAPLVATLLVVRIVGGRFRIAPLLAKVFTPLFLVTVIAYLAAMMMSGKSPFTDRDFLIAFNGLLLVVLGLCVFSISERGARASAGIGDFMNIGLVAVTLVIDVIALAAIFFRLTSYGFTPNRVAVLGANLLAFVHLSGILWRYVRFARGKAGMDSLDHWIARYLPAYTTWALVVAVGFPLVFRFK